jgi:hypothetical protein
MRKFLIPAVAILLGAVSQAQAGPIYDPTVSTCTGANCSSVYFGGTVLGSGSTTAGQWVQEVFARAGQCVRLQVLSESFDLAMTVVAPDGSIYANDQGGGSCVNCPVVKINNAPNTGWYTVNVARAFGAAGDGNFTLAYGVYPLNNANCAGATQPFSSGAASLTSATSSRPADVAPRNAPPLR